MSTLSKLRRLVLRQDVSVREASRRLGISRNTATKWLKDGQMVEPRYPQRVSAPSILDPYTAWPVHGRRCWAPPA